MKLIKSLKLAFNILIHSKVRSSLSIIGIVIGVASVIAILSLGAGMQQSLNERLGSLGSDIITISPGASRASGSQAGFRDDDFGGRGRTTISETKNITSKDVEALKLIPNVGKIEGTVSKRADVGYLSETSSFSVKGVDPKVWKDMVVSKLEAGRYLSQGDTNVVVIGSRIASGRFKENIQLNRQITIEGKPFRVVGILKASTGFGSDDSNIYMPIDTARITLKDVDAKALDSIEIKIKDVNQIDDTLAQIESRLMLTRAVNDRTKDFSVNSVKEMQESISQTLTIMTLFLGAIAAISLLVGAIGIANTMFTTVLEKTKEIGIMKSVGAKNKDILLIFLFNSAMIGLTGGIIGSLLGILGSEVFSIFTVRLMGGVSATTIVTPQLVILVVGFSVLIGIIAGVVPAYRASKMNPVDALRYE